MYQLTVESIKRSCAFVLRVESPVKTLEKICSLLASKSMKITMLQLQSIDNSDATLVIHCQIDKDRIPYFVACFEKMAGVIELEWMEAKGRNKQYGK